MFKRAHNRPEKILTDGFEIRPATAVFCGLLYIVLAGWSAGAAWFILSRDDLVARVLSRQTAVQYAYEERIASLRAQLDRVTSKQVVNQDSFEARVDRLTTRQAQIETRHAIVASLVRGAGSGARNPSTAPSQPLAGLKEAPLDAVGGPDIPEARSGLQNLPRSAKPAPLLTAPSRQRTDADERPALRGRHDEEATLRPSATIADIPARLQHVERTLAAVEQAQVRTLEQVSGEVGRRIERLTLALRETGLEPKRYMPTGPAGGPFVPAGSQQGNVFDRLAASLRVSLAVASRLDETVEAMPLVRPIAGDADLTSTFGYRLDPFTRSPALHSGIDFRGETGTPVHAAGAGVVTLAEYWGGYGNVVEIEHAGGVTSRYAHLSSIGVREGQRVRAGETVGRVGSTGRSTGPHLHYETRIDGEAVDPARFLRAGQRLN